MKYVAIKADLFDDYMENSDTVFFFEADDMDAAIKKLDKMFEHAEYDYTIYELTGNYKSVCNFQE